MKKIKLAITTGDPSGIGAEIACKFAESIAQNDEYEVILVSYEYIIRHTFETLLNKPMPPLTIVEPDEKLTFDIEYGVIKPEYGKASMLFVEKAVRMVQSGEADAVVTCPINKASIKEGGYNFPGHTEFLGFLTKSRHFSMLMVGDKVRCVLATTHVPMEQLVDKLDEKAIMNAILNANAAGQFFCGKRQPRIAVCGLNPHAGDNGALGDEEITLISPVVEIAQAEGIDVEGPFPADSLFVKAAKGEYDFVVVMYHDQGLIPVKMESFGNAVNVTLNLPIIRTSVDHGTAFDIAGKGIASCTSIKRASEVAAEMVKNARLA
ncbi:4-hydroxythreonine-4-phosphate dehydrogenase PdxA [Seleniivibrio woodruffii]|uniref:4-hydroxythreonine-4-phosphate dehydrogenase PdxA n=1 Tax=Seleniivibrio woodruffii TaxID=1078050 RepID=UPI0026F078DC|nr:4-hydroxythreonine-4-phosphate dehydrogenase PdxA [Seleniivibrio woodruffii]